jgi:hypothetical protein
LAPDGFAVERGLSLLRRLCEQRQEEVVTVVEELVAE